MANSILKKKVVRDLTYQIKDAPGEGEGEREKEGEEENKAHVTMKICAGVGLAKQTRGIEQSPAIFIWNIWFSIQNITMNSYKSEEKTQQKHFTHSSSK